MAHPRLGDSPCVARWVQAAFPLRRMHKPQVRATGLRTATPFRGQKTLYSAMLIKLLAAFIVLPLVELALLIQIGNWIGLVWTLALVVVTGIVGAALARRHGLAAWIAIRDELRAGRMPASALADGLLILIGGIVLLTPGLLTDILGFALLVPVSRAAFKRALSRRFQRAVERGDTSITVLMR